MAAQALPLAPEAPVALYIDGTRAAVLFCSPFDLDELAVGYAVSRRLISERGDLASLAVRPDQRSVSLCTASGKGIGRKDEGFVFSACGAAAIREYPEPEERKDPRAGTGDLPRALPGPLDIDALGALSRRMFASAELYRKTGGMHIAALASYPGERGAYFAAREDVGRHNAVDKVVGRGFLDGVDFRGAVLLTSGRIACDMVLKADAAGIPILVSRSIPTTEAYRLALERRIILVGRMGSAEPIVYSGGSL